MRKSKTVAKVSFLSPDVETKIIPSPTDGWDAISPLAEMDPKRAPNSCQLGATPRLRGSATRHVHLGQDRTHISG